MEIVHVPVSYLFRYFIDFYVLLGKKSLGMLDAPVVDVGIEVFSDLLGEELAEVGAVVSEERRDGLELDIVLVIVVNIVQDVIEDRISR